MMFLSRLYPGDAFAIGALNVLVQVTAVSLLALLFSRSFAVRNAALRHCVLLAALSWIVVSPLAVWRLSRTGLLTIRLTSSSHAAETYAANYSPPIISAPLGSPAPIESIDVSAPVPQAAFPSHASERPQGIPPSPAKLSKLHAAIATLMLTWIAMTCVLLLRLTCGLCFVIQVRRRATPAAVPDFVRQQLGRVLDIETLPAILISDRISSPATIGIIRPAIVFPTGLLDQIAPDELHDVLVHECAHALRRDCAIGIVQRLVAAAFWFHPIVHLLNRQLRLSREEVCDNAVLANRHPSKYARTLLTLSQRMPTARTPALLPGFFDRAWPLEHRVAGLLNQRRIVMTRVTKSTRLATAAYVAILGFILSSIGISHAQSSSERGPQTPAPPPATSVSPDARIERNDRTLSLDPAGLISPGEEALQSHLAEAHRAVRRAELTVKEAEIKAEAAQLDLDRKLPLLASKSIPDSEVEQARLDAQLATIGLERAKIGLDEAMATAMPTRLVGLSLWDSQNQAPDQYGQYPVRSDSRSVRFFVQQHFKDALRGGWEISLLRESRTVPVLIFTGARNLDADSPFGNEPLQAGDRICIRRDLVRVLKGPNEKSAVIFQTTLQGKKLTIPELLKLAGVQYGTHDENRHILLTGRRVPPAAGRDYRWWASLAQIASGFGKDQVLEPDDIVVLNAQ